MLILGGPLEQFHRVMFLFFWDPPLRLGMIRKKNPELMNGSWKQGTWLAWNWPRLTRVQFKNMTTKLTISTSWRLLGQV